MEKKIEKLMTVTVAALLFLGPSANADCLQHYKSAGATAGDFIRGAGLNDDEGAAPFVTTSAPGLVSSSAYDVVTNKDKVVSLINDAKAGDGLILASFAQETQMTKSDAAALVKSYNDNGVICSNELYSYSDIVKLAKTQ